MKVRINGTVAEYETIEELEDAIDNALEDEYERGKDDGFDDGLKDGRGEGYSDGYLDAEKEHELAIPDDRRAKEMRLDLYRAIYAGNMEKAEDIANLMAMVDIDRELIWQARREVRVK